MVKLSNLNLFTILLFTFMFLAGCNKASSNKSFSLEIKDSTGKVIARGNLSLPKNLEDSVRFTGSCKITVLKVPENPSSQNEYAIRTLSEKNGEYSGSIGNGKIHIVLHPRIDDDDIYLEGKYNEQLIEGKCIYQSYAGELEFGTFEAKSVKK